MGLMDMLKTSDPMAKFYAAAEKSNVPQGGITGKLFSAMFPHGLGNLAFGREPEPMPPLETPEGTALMADLASNMMVPGTFIGPKGLARLFGDDAAKGMLATAESKLAQGVPKEAVFQELGVFKGPEGKWRYEIDDSGARYAFNPYGGNKLGKSLQHDEVYKAYPKDVSEIQISEGPSSIDGRYSPGSGGIGSDSIRIRAKSPNQQSTLLHELQHAVQEREGFARGGSPDMFQNVTKDSVASLNSLLENHKGLVEKYGEEKAGWLITGEKGAPVGTATREIKRLEQELEELIERQISGRVSAVDMYQNLAGEAEARAVQDRMNMPMSERRSIFPDYAKRDDLIIRGLMSP